MVALLNPKTITCSIPALNKSTGKWCRDVELKGNLLAETFKSKYKREKAAINYYTAIALVLVGCRGPQSVAEVTEEDALQTLEAL